MLHLRAEAQKSMTKNVTISHNFDHYPQQSKRLLPLESPVYSLFCIHFFLLTFSLALCVFSQPPTLGAHLF